MQSGFLSFENPDTGHMTVIRIEDIVSVVVSKREDEMCSYDVKIFTSEDEDDGYYSLLGISGQRVKKLKSILEPEEF